MLGKRVDLTPKELNQYIGCQVELLTNCGQQLYPGEVEKIWIEGMGNNEILFITFSWLARDINYPDGVQKWVFDSRESYNAQLVSASPYKTGNRLVVMAPIIGEQIKLFPSGEIILHRQDVA